jgi:hypothetical protein
MFNELGDQAALSYVKEEFKYAFIGLVRVCGRDPAKWPFSFTVTDVSFLLPPLLFLIFQDNKTYDQSNKGTQYSKVVAYFKKKKEFEDKRESPSPTTEGKILSIYFINVS